MPTIYNLFQVESGISKNHLLTGKDRNDLMVVALNHDEDGSIQLKCIVVKDEDAPALNLVLAPGSYPACRQSFTHD